MGDVLKQAYEEAEEQKGRDNTRILDGAYFMYTLKFFIDNAKQYRVYAKSKDNQEEYAGQRLMDSDIDLLNKSVRLLTHTTDANEGFAVIVIYGIDNIHSNNYVIFPDTVIKF